ncbi:Alpha/Beta hydrolase protein [Rhypophila decipiens]|uniref:Alpha/Beta hydrolase protein n=1 Tax=Rhypophila decipiens TaxID=261697 RepID=A0AAN7B428_9PEZI|nr:Alpha/Beta hydrolase protein [Rhypophila decipiens]
MEDQTISLTTKSGASLKISTFFPPPSKEEQNNPLKHTLLVFLNGLILPRSLWAESIYHLLSLRASSHLPAGIITYDRYGQGDSDPDPSDPPDTPYGHDALTIITDLHQLLTQVSHQFLKRRLESLELVFVANSIGCPLARLYAARYPGSVAGVLCLDSMMANSDFVDSLFPDPDDAAFESGKLPPGISVEDIRFARERFRAFFHPSVTNPERFDRRNMAKLLPRAHGPVLPPVGGTQGRRPRVVVVGHDAVEFARQSEEGSLAVPKRITNAYVDPAWSEYNKGLTQLGESQDRTSPEGGNVKIAKGCGHFIQKDDPVFVAREISTLLDYLSRTPS